MRTLSKSLSGASIAILISFLGIEAYAMDIECSEGIKRGNSVPTRQNPPQTPSLKRPHPIPSTPEEGAPLAKRLQQIEADIPQGTNVDFKFFNNMKAYLDRDDNQWEDIMDDDEIFFKNIGLPSIQNLIIDCLQNPKFEISKINAYILMRGAIKKGYKNGNLLKVLPDVEKFLSYFIAGHENGDYFATECLAILYARGWKKKDGTEVPPDIRKALNLYLDIWANWIDEKDEDFVDLLESHFGADLLKSYFDVRPSPSEIKREANMISSFITSEARWGAKPNKMIQKEEEDTSEIKTISSHFKLKSTTSNESTDRETVAELQAKQSFYKKATDCLTDLIDFINYKGPKSDWNSVFDDPFLCINVPADFVPRIREVGLPIFKSSKDVDAEASAARFRIYELQGVISLTLDQSSEKTTIKLVDRFVNAMESLQELKEHYMIKATKLASLVHGEEKKKVKLAMYKKNSSKFAFSEEDIQKKVMRNQNLLSSSEQSKQKALKKHQDLEHIETSIRSLFEKAQPLKNYGMYKELVDEEEDIDEDE